MCEVGCNPKPDVAWTFNGAPIVEDERHTLKTNGNTRYLLTTNREIEYIERASSVEIYWSLLSQAHFMTY